MNFQKLFGSNFKWFYTLRYFTLSAGAGGLTNVLSMCGAIIAIVGLAYVWHLGNATSALFSYLLLGRLYKSIGENYFLGQLSADIISGSLTNVLLLPQGTFKFYYISMLGKRIFRNLVEFIGFAIATAICVFWFAKVEFNWNLLPITLLFVPISFTINHFMGTIIGSFAFFIKDKRDFFGLDNFYFNLRTVLAGFLIPLNLLPFNKFFESLPFAWQLHHPMQVYLGKYDFKATVLAFLAGVAWCIVLYFLAKITFKLGLKKNESVGLYRANLPNTHLTRQITILYNNVVSH